LPHHFISSLPGGLKYDTMTISLGPRFIIHCLHHVATILRRRRSMATRNASVNPTTGKGGPSNQQQKQELQVETVESIVDPHFASSQKWSGNQACARLCKIALESNKGILQCIIEGHTELLDMLTNEELEEIDPDSGLNAPYLAIYYDRPKIVKYLHERGLDMSKFCDGMDFGTCIFYAVSYLRYEILELLEQLEYDIIGPCDEFGQTPLERAAKMENKELTAHLEFLIGRRTRVHSFMAKNCMRYLHRQRYLRLYRALLVVERVIRGYIGRCRANNKRRELKQVATESKGKSRRMRNVDIDP
jgi:hypothetical protein